ncbi:MAG: hypothetical protein GXP18_09840 [Gammaproteobacteria bacterium]|nr:hypothetical protein [Gammaproteobacteria bacterium]
MVVLHTIANGATLKGEIEGRYDNFAEDSLFNEQSVRQEQYSLATTLNYHRQVNRDVDINISVFGRYHPEANEPWRGDVRELKWSHYASPFEISGGVLMERWGVLEAFSPVDILNPRDRVEDFQGDIKQGIPGGKLSWLLGDGGIDIWFLPYSREERLAEGKDRFRTSAFAFSDAEFEKGQYTLSSAIRISQMLESVELAISYYNGHVRSPYFTPVLDGAGNAISLQPNYAWAEQTGLELLWVRGQLLAKLESIYRSSDEGDFLGLGIGLEREFPRIISTRGSLTLYGEYYYDERESDRSFPLTPFQNDIFLGFRLAQNNLSSTVYEVRLTYDLDYESTFWDLRVKTRIKRQWLIEASLYKFSHVDNDPALRSFASDSRFAVNIILGF